MCPQADRRFFENWITKDPVADDKLDNRACEQVWGKHPLE